MIYFINLFFRKLFHNTTSSHFNTFLSFLSLSVFFVSGCKHVKGIMLFGPPGCGKTLMARQIGKMLNAREPKVVNGPEILNKYVGESEANIRKLFAEAEDEQKRVRDIRSYVCICSIQKQTLVHLQLDVFPAGSQQRPPHHHFR